MTMKEKLTIHKEIEEANRRHVLRWRAKRLHFEAIRNGDYFTAITLMILLRLDWLDGYLDD